MCALYNNNVKKKKLWNDFVWTKCSGFRYLPNINVKESRLGRFVSDLVCGHSFGRVTVIVRRFVFKLIVVDGKNENTILSALDNRIPTGYRTKILFSKNFRSSKCVRTSCSLTVSLRHKISRYEVRTYQTSVSNCWIPYVG